jgi:hypothetical protein
MSIRIHDNRSNSELEPATWRNQQQLQEENLVNLDRSRVPGNRVKKENWPLERENYSVLNILTSVI